MELIIKINNLVCGVMCLIIRCEVVVMMFITDISNKMQVFFFLAKINNYHEKYLKNLSFGVVFKNGQN